jgi:hypothetical protein
MQDAFQLKFDLMENANKATIMNLQQEQTRKDEENKQLKEKLVKLEAELNRNTDNDLSYNSRKDDDNNDISYDSESSDAKEHDNIRHITHQNTSKNDSNEIYADPNYNSSDNEDPRNDLYLD